MTITRFPNGISSFGVPVFGSGGFPMTSVGSHFWVDSVNGSDSNDGTSPTRAKKKFSVGYALMTTNKHDVLHVIGGATEYAETAVVTMDKDYCHVVAHTTPGYTGGRARLTNTVTTATAGEYVISGTGCTFQGLHIQWGDSATDTSVIGCSITGGRNTFINCQFEGPFQAAMGAAAAIRMISITSAQDLTFIGCDFGQRTIINTSSTGAIISFDGTNNNMHVFENCIFHSYQSNTGAGFIHLTLGALPTSGSLLFRKCTFINHHAASMADVFRNDTTASGLIVLDDCVLAGLGTLIWATNRKTNIFTTRAASVGSGGYAVVCT
jgi:hypothetical protein